jgi:adenylosuccinate synthase
MAQVITPSQKAWELNGKLPGAIGSTGSGTGAAVMARTARHSENFPLSAVKAEDVPELEPFLRNDTTALLRSFLKQGKRVVIEGTQGFGLSLLHAETWPKATSRDTTAAGFVAEAGLSPLDVDDVTLVLRCHPIRVAGDSGPLVGEVSWKIVAQEAGLPDDLSELTTVTRKVRRVARFDPAIVRKAIAANRPSRVVLNHLDYIDPAVRNNLITAKAQKFIENVEASIEQSVDWYGIGPDKLITKDNAAFRNSIEDVVDH